MDKLVEHLFIFGRNEPIEDFPGNYSIYREHLKNKSQPVKMVAPTETKKVDRQKPKAPSKKMSFNEKTEFENLEKEIATCTLKKEKLISDLNSGENDHEKLQTWGEELKTVEAAIDEKELRWLELSELV